MKSSQTGNFCGRSLGRSAVTASEGEAHVNEVRYKKRKKKKREKESEKIKEDTLALVHFSLILEEMLEAIKEGHQKQLFFCSGFHTADEGRPVCSENQFCLKTLRMKRTHHRGSGNMQY